MPFATTTHAIPSERTQRQIDSLLDEAEVRARTWPSEIVPLLAVGRAHFCGRSC
jgi:hypothetical protein